MRCYILGAVIALHLLLLSVQANLKNQDGEMVFQEPMTVKHVHRPGDREHLSPNLLGLQNIAVTFLPLTKTFVNIIEAFREIVNGVRYDILLNTVHMGMNGEEETVCRLVILEKPWLRTEWGDKVRLLQYSNCTSDADEDLFGKGATFDSDTSSDRFIKNPLFDGGYRNKLSTTELKRLEGQIISAISSKRFNETKTTTSQNFAESSTYGTNTESDKESQGESSKSAELSESDKEWLNNFFSIGALNFEKSLQDATASPPDSAQVQESPLTRSKRSYNDRITGAPTKLDHNDAEKRLKNALKTLATGEGPTFKLLRIHKASTQLVAGLLTKIDCDLENAEDGKLEHCKVEIWSQPWLNEGAEITIKCPNKELVTSRLSRSVENAEKKIHKKRDHFNLNKVEHLFAKFQLKYKRQYHTVAEKQMRLRIFAKNLKLIAELNRKEMGSAKYGITEFADFTTEEYKLRTGLWSKDRKTAASNATAVIPNIDLPKEFDWRDKGAVTKVKNQGMCGSCWAFSAIGNIEGLQAIQSKYLVEFSEQELLDCDTEDKACMGGLPDNAFEAIKKIGGLELESDYPYHGHKEKCLFNLEAAHVYVKDHVDLPKNETAIAQWLVANGPISIGINANAMQFYRGGVSHPWHMLCSHKSLDHGVLIVGYGVSEYPMFKKTLPYWIIKNSWGSKWGEQGYYRVYRGDNSCGVSEMASSAIIT